MAGKSIPQQLIQSAANLPMQTSEKSIGIFFCTTQASVSVPAIIFLTYVPVQLIIPWFTGTI